MGEPLRNNPHVPLVDLDTIRETLVFIRDDIQRVPGMERAAEGLSTVLAEIDAATRRRVVLSAATIDVRRPPPRKH
jgi:hypothetical protein